MASIAPLVVVEAANGSSVNSHLPVPVLILTQAARAVVFTSSTVRLLGFQRRQLGLRGPPLGDAKQRLGDAPPNTMD